MARLNPQCAASPRCKNTPQYGHRGMCYKHYISDQKERNRSGEFVYGFEPVEKVVAHLDMLLASGMSLRRIADQSGVSTFGLIKMRENKKYVRRNTAEALYAVDPLSSWKREDWGRVPADGTRRRLQALVALGYTQKEIANLCNISVTNITYLTLGHNQVVRIPTAKKILAVYERLQMTPAPKSAAATYSRRRAKEKGWLPPMAWDEDAIDAIDAQPVAAVSGKDDWINDYKELREMGLTQVKIAERWGIELDSLKQRILRVRKRNASISID